LVPPSKLLGELKVTRTTFTGSFFYSPYDDAADDYYRMQFHLPAHEAGDEKRFKISASGDQVTNETLAFQQFQGGQAYHQSL